MKVNLAAQDFSSSVADAIQYCANVLKLTQFQATFEFIRLFDRLFDIFNTRNHAPLVSRQHFVSRIKAPGIHFLTKRIIT